MEFNAAWWQQIVLLVPDMPPTSTAFQLLLEDPRRFLARGTCYPDSEYWASARVRCPTGNRSASQKVGLFGCLPTPLPPR